MQNNNYSFLYLYLREKKKQRNEQGTLQPFIFFFFLISLFFKLDINFCTGQYLKSETTREKWGWTNLFKTQSSLDDKK